MLKLYAEDVEEPRWLKGRRAELCVSESLAAQRRALEPFAAQPCPDGRARRGSVAGLRWARRHPQRAEELGLRAAPLRSARVGPSPGVPSDLGFSVIFVKKGLTSVTVIWETHYRRLMQPMTKYL